MWEDIDNSETFSKRTSTGTLPNAWTASQWNGTPREASFPPAHFAYGFNRADLVICIHHRNESCFVINAFQSRFRCNYPIFINRNFANFKSLCFQRICRIMNGTCSIAEMTMLPSPHWSAIPRIARLSDPPPPDVKNNSLMMHGELKPIVHGGFQACECFSSQRMVHDDFPNIRHGLSNRSQNFGPDRRGGIVVKVYHSNQFRVIV